MTLRAEKVCASLVLFVMLGGGFFSLATWTDGRSVPAPNWLLTPIDRAVPVVPSFVWIYLSWYPALWATSFSPSP